MNFHNLVNKDELQKLQDGFCRVAGVSMLCLSPDGERITEPSSVKEQEEQMKQCLASFEFQAALERVEQGSLEEMATETLGDEAGMVTALSIRAGEEAVLIWVVYCDYTMDIQRYEEILDLLRDTSLSLVAIEMSYFGMEAENRRNRFEHQELSRDLRTVEATTQIVQLLDSDESIEAIIDKWMRILCEYLEVDTAQVFQIHDDGKLMDVVSEWRKEGMIPYFDRTSNIPTYAFSLVMKPLVVSNDSFIRDYQEDLAKTELKALIIFPIIAGQSATETENKGGMILSLNHRKEPHIWKMEEVKFTADAVRVVQSIMTRRIQKNSLASSFSALEAILDNVGSAVYVEDVETKGKLFANRIMQSLFPTENVSEEFLACITSEERQAGSGALQPQFLKDGRWYDLISKDITWVDGRKAMLYSFYDVTEKKRYQERIEQQAFTDFLTGLYNRMCCERDLAILVDEAKKTGQIGAMLYLDLDNFKHINDGLGHQYGDVLLKEISKSIREVEGIENTCYRMGGDEFVIIIPPDQYTKFEEILDKLKTIFGTPWYLKDSEYYCTMSMGVVTFPDEGEFVAELIKKADIAMYEAKKSGKNRIATYHDGNDSASGRRLDMENNMRNATLDGYKEFEVYYQPIFDVESGRKKCVGAEALIRWNSEKLGFIPLAEYLGLINPIGNYVLEEACAQCKKWNEMGYPDYKVNVNLSVVQLLQNDMIELLQNVLEVTKINPANLTLEVTESLAINDMDKMKRILDRIKALGVKIALDDFGTGYSSLNHIREIPFDVIKVDQSFVKDLAEDAYARAFIKMVAELGEAIGVSICVEGVEKKEQYQVLKDMKVKYIQGFYFDHPMPRDKFEEKYLTPLAKKGKTM